MLYLLKFWIKSLFVADNISPSAISRIKFRVMPWDCDPNRHMTNSRYFAYMDYARFWRYFHMGVFKDIFINKRWMPMAVSQEITYIRDIAPFEKFEIRSQFVGWDEKYYYVVQDFYGRKGLCAKAMIRGVFVHNKKPVPIDELLTAFGQPPKVEKYQERIDTWKHVLELKKAENELVIE